jgi:hypothetical protein
MTVIPLILLAALAGVDFTIAPDQPLPHVYVDDPLVIELKSPVETVASVHLTVEAPHLAAPFGADLPEARLRPPGAYWWAVPNAPQERGYYTVRLQVKTGDITTESPGVFCRLDRPSAATESPLFADAEGADPNLLRTLLGTGVKMLRIDANTQNLAAQIQTVAHYGMQIALRANVKAVGDPVAFAQNTVQPLGASAPRWDIECEGDWAGMALLSHNIQQANRRAALNLSVVDAESLKSALTGGAGKSVQGFLLPWNVDLAAAQQAAESVGYEGVSIAIQPETPTLTQPAVFILRRSLEAASFGVLSVGIPAQAILNKTIAEGCVYANTLARHYAGLRYVGSLQSESKEVQTLVFRQRNRWLLAAWAKAEQADLIFEPGDVRDLVCVDARNNPRPLPPVAENRLTLTLSSEPLLLSGAGGGVLGQAALDTTRNEAEGLIKKGHFEQSLSGNSAMAPALEVVRRLSQGQITYDRTDFFALLKVFPDVEMRWHTRQLARSQAVPAVAGLARLARAICTLEEENGRPFLQPIKDTLAKCSEYQSMYLTSTGGAATRHERADWLLSEVSRLVAEAEALQQDGRAIEAGAVASMAEYRALALEPAMKALPLSEPEPPVAPPEPVVAPKPENKSEPEKAGDDKSSQKTEEKAKTKKPSRRSSRSKSKSK